VATPPVQIVEALNDLVIDGGPITVNVAVLLVSPTPLSFELIIPVLLSHTPVVEPVTVTLKLQLPLPVSVPPLKVILFDAALVVSVPPQVVVLESPTVTPEGSVSLKLIPVRFSDAFGLVTVNVKLVVAFSKMLDDPNDFITVGGLATFRFAVAMFPVPPLF